MNDGASFQDGEQVLLIDQRGKRHLIFLRKSETFHSDRGWISHDAIIGQPEGTWVRSSMGLRYVALRPTLAEFVLDMPRGAQVIYPKDLAMILFWADVYPGCRVLEAGMGSGALTLALLRAVGPDGRVITYEQRDEFARRALEETGALVLPGSAFGPAGEGYFRIALTVGPDRLKEAAKRLGGILEATRRGELAPTA